MSVFRYPRKRLIILLCFLLFLLIFTYLLRHKDPVSECNVPNEVHEKIGDLIIQLTNALDALNLSYFLCYNSLWGALKTEGPFIWQRNVEFCVLNKEVSLIDEVFLVRTFKRYGLTIHYNNANGVYNVQLIGYNEPTGFMYVFEEDSVTHQMRRVGWTHRLYPPGACDQLHCFPKDLINPPLALANFGAHKLPVPNEGIEIQKYLFPDSWWKENTGPSCS